MIWQEQRKSINSCDWQGLAIVKMELTGPHTCMLGSTYSSCMCRNMHCSYGGCSATLVGIADWRLGFVFASTVLLLHRHWGCFLGSGQGEGSAPERRGRRR